MNIRDDLLQCADCSKTQPETSWQRVARLSLILFVSVFPLLTYSVCRAQEPGHSVLRSRSDFVKRMSMVQLRMPESQVLSFLGRPDTVKNGVWLYGVDRKSGFPTLGTVQFTKTRTVFDTKGANGTPPSERQISERELRYLIGVLSRFDGDDDGEQFDPKHYIQTTNTLLPFGKAKIMAATFEYRRVKEDLPHNLLYLLAVLFDPSLCTSDFPSFISRHPVPPRPEDKSLVPRFPIVLIEDVPLLIMNYIRGDGLSGSDSIEYAFLRYLQAQGRLRRKPLRPTTRPLKLLDKLMHSDQWLFGRQYKTDDNLSPREPREEKLGKRAVQYQLLRLVRSVLPETKAYLQGAEISGNIDSVKWQQLQKTLDGLPVVWDTTRNDDRLQ